MFSKCKTAAEAVQTIRTLAAGRVVLNAADLAVLLGTSRDVIYNAVYAGVFPIRSQKLGGRRVWHIDDVIAAVTEGRS